MGVLAIVLGLLALVSAHPVAGAPADRAALVAAINQAGRQRMLSQRAAKAYLMIALDEDAERSRAMLTQSLHLAERELEQLDRLPVPETADARAQLRRAWKEYRVALADAASPNNLRAVYDESDAVLAIAHRLTLLYDRAAGGPRDRLVNIAGRQRMLSQRLAKLYLYQWMGVHVEPARMEFNLAYSEFDTGMAQLRRAAHQSSEIRAMIARLDGEWAHYRQALSPPAATSRAAVSKMLAASERILSTLEALVRLYELQAGGAFAES